MNSLVHLGLHQDISRASLLYIFYENLHVLMEELRKPLFAVRLRCHSVVLIVLEHSAIDDDLVFGHVSIILAQAVGRDKLFQAIHLSLGQPLHEESLQIRGEFSLIYLDSLDITGLQKAGGGLTS